ncbi:MAG TPA: DUF2127 domain-containing protein [Terriglobales bacterium]|nr:DUF2127 domain-containing protein [Terriglobales bacterium]
MGTLAHIRLATNYHNHQAAHRKVLQAVASFELAKGLVVLAAGLSVLLIVHRDTGDIADWCLRVLHISPDHHFAQVFLNWADTLTEQKLFAVAGVAGVYAILRFVEAYGLWHARAWAEWIALISGGMYLPFEIYKLIHRPNLFHGSVFIINVAVVIYMAFLLVTGRARRTKLGLH